METSPFYVIPIFSEHSLFPPSKQSLHNSQLLQKLSCQKPCWDEARLFSLVNEQVGSDVAVVSSSHTVIRGLVNLKEPYMKVKNRFSADYLETR